MSRSRSWCFTLNNYSEEDEVACHALALACKYIVIGKEVGESGTPHLQGFVYMEDKYSLSVMREWLSRAHWEPMKGTPLQAADYCKKDGDFFEWGTPPLSQEEKGVKGKEYWESQVLAYAEGRREDVDADIYVRFGAGLARAAAYYYPPVLVDTDFKMEWYYGGSGTGKSRRAREENPGAYLKMCNKWWDGYHGQDVVIIEDFDRDHKVLCHHLKIWADRYPFPAEVKGGKVDIRPKKIIVTSNYHPRDIWENPQDVEPILRRFRITHFDKLIY
jgi:hypothetical protein